MNDASLTGSERFSGQKVRVYPVTRIQGRADIEVTFDQQQEVSGARFRALEVRGFERLVVGMPALRAPQVLSRICGPCGPFHQLASCQALEKAAGLEVPAVAEVVREMLCWLWLAHSHLLSLTYNALPDLALPMSDVAVRNIAGIYMVEQEAVGGLSSILTAVHQALAVLTGMPVHPAIVVPGGVSSVPGTVALARAAEILEGCEDDLRETLRLLEMLLKRDSQMMYTGKPLKGNYMSVTSGGNCSPLGDSVTIEPFGDGESATLNHKEFAGNLEEKPVPWSYLVPVSYEGFEPLLVGPLARVNLGYGSDSQWADLELTRCYEQWGRPLDREFLVYMALMLEVILAYDKVRALLIKVAGAGDEACAVPELTASSGVAVVDSPRGIIVHALTVDDSGTVTGYKVTSPLQFNYSMMNRHLSDVAEEVVTGIEIGEAVAQRLQLAVRAFIPCVSCGTH